MNPFGRFIRSLWTWHYPNYLVRFLRIWRWQREIGSQAKSGALYSIISNGMTSYIMRIDIKRKTTHLPSGDRWFTKLPFFVDSAIKNATSHHLARHKAARSTMVYICVRANRLA